MRENFQRRYLGCLVALIEDKRFTEIQENIQCFINALSPSDPELKKRLTSFFLLLVPIPISREISSFEKPPAQLVLETVPIFSFLLSRGKIDLQAGKEGICFKMPLMRTVRESLALLGRGRISARSERIFEENLFRFCEFFTFFYDRKLVGEIMTLIKNASALIGLLLAGEKKCRDVEPDDLKKALHILRSILFRIPRIDWIVIGRLSKFQRGTKINGLIQWPVFSANQEKKLKAYFYQQLEKKSQRSFLKIPEEFQSTSSLLFRSFVNFFCIQRWQLKLKNVTNTSIDYYFTEFQRICEQSAGITFSKALSMLSEIIPSSEAHEILKVLKKRITEYIQLSKVQQSFLSYKYEYSTFLERQRPFIVLFSMLNALKRPDKTIGREEILLGFTYWTDLLSS